MEMALNMFTWLLSWLFFFALFGDETSAQNSNLTTSNGTFPPTTPAAVTTPSGMATSTPVPPKPLPKNTDIGPCLCDLMINSCDVNCCCDKECSSEDRTSFSECITFNSIIDDRLCFQEDIFFAVNSRLYSNRSSNGIFCIYYDNYPSRNFYKNPDLVTNINMFEEYVRKNSVPSFQRRPQTPKKIAEFYKSGDPIQIIYGNDTLGYLLLPRALSSEYCADFNPASYLFDQTFECVRNIQSLPSECEMTPALKATTYFTDFSIIPSPGIFKDINITEENIPTELLTDLYNNNLTIPFTKATFCKDFECISFEQINSTSFLPLYNRAEDICYNVVEKVFYEILYKGTAGIVSIDIKIHLTDVRGLNIRMTQTFGTEFKQSKGIPRRKSGNPGYVRSEPIIAGTMEQLITNQKTLQFIKMNIDRDNWLTLPMSTASGECSRTSRVPVKFGQEIRTGCFIRATNNDLRTLCKQLQNRTTNILLGNSVYTHVASFGNTSVTDVGDWVPILGLNKQPELLPFEDRYCSLALGLQIQVIFARVGSISNPQSKILGVAYNFEQRRKIYPECLGQFCQGTSSHLLELIGSVTYVDASQPVVEIIAEPPTYRFGVPFDFFYPFISNKADRLVLPKVAKILATSLTLFFFFTIL